MDLGAWSHPAVSFSIIQTILAFFGACGTTDAIMNQECPFLADHSVHTIEDMTIEHGFLPLSHPLLPHIASYTRTICGRQLLRGD